VRCAWLVAQYDRSVVASAQPSGQSEECEGQQAEQHVHDGVVWRLEVWADETARLVRESTRTAWILKHSRALFSVCAVAQPTMAYTQHQISLAGRGCIA